MWRIRFQNFKGHNCYIDISYDSSSSAIALTPSKKPFEVEIDNNDDIFTPVRTSTGNLGIIINRVSANGVQDSSATLRELLNAQPLSHPVTLWCDNKAGWKGFIKSESYDHKLFGASEELSIPIISSLKALEGVNVSITVGSNNYWKTFGQILIEMTDRVGAPFEYFALPTSMMQQLSNPMAAFINLLTYVEMRSPESFETDEQGNTIYYDGKPYSDVLTDFCKVTSLTAVECGNTLIFQRAHGRTTNYSFYTRQQVLDGCRTATKTESLDEKNITDFFTFANTDHTFSTISGRNAVEVVGKKSELDEPFSLSSIRDMCKTIGDGTAFFDDETNTIAENRLTDCPMIECINNDMPQNTRGVLDACNWGQGLRGSFVELLGEISDIKRVGSYIYSYSGSVSPCVLLIDSQASFTLKPLVACSFSAPAVVLKMRIKVKNTATGKWEKPAPLPMGNMSLHVRINGTLQNTIEEEDNITCVLFNYNGEPLTITKNVNRTEMFLKIEQLEMSYNSKGIDRYGADESYDSDIVEKRSMSNGFTEDYKVEIGLKSKGYGINTFWGVPSSEKVLADRAALYYKDSKAQITISVNGESFIDPRRIFIYNNIPYSVIGQKMNAYDSTIKLTLQETLRS